MIRQYRHGTKQVTLEIPGGLMDPGDASPQAAAERELGEETGYSAQQWHYLGKIAPNPAMQSNLCHSFLALNARETAVQNLDHAEEIRVVCVPRGEIEARIRAGEISHALVVVAFYYLSLFERDH
ncbi:MAG: NUDIX hydrolase [Deltaproteobacteria bacterium]|nr:NUDIX hydrolase [Deltaproteobacteria bacterium]